MNICDDMLQYIFKYTVNVDLIINALYKNDMRLIKLFFNNQSRLYFWEYISKYPNDWVIKNLCTPRTYDEMFYQLKGKIRANDWKFLENFTDYRSVLLNDLIMFCIEFKSISGFIYFINKLDQIQPVFFDRKILEYASQAQKYDCDMILDYIRYRFDPIH